MQVWRPHGVVGKEVEDAALDVPKRSVGRADDADAARALRDLELAVVPLGFSGIGF